MSIWTHVIGTIRIDGSPRLTGISAQAISDLLGPMCTFEHWNDDSTIPCGSEGGLQYQVIEYSDGLPWCCVPIWGDLRDYNDAEEIKAWFLALGEKVKALGGCMVRDSVLHIRVEGQEPIIVTIPDPA